MLDERLRRIGQTTIGVLFVLAAGARLSAAPVDKAGLQIILEKSTISLADGNRPILRYRYADVPMKPYADQLFSPAGVQVLRDSPFDHKHHHGLMYALAVEGVDFWAEFDAQYGKQRQRMLRVVKATPQSGGRAGFVQELDWLGPASAKPLLVERRAVNVLKAADLGATLVQWCSGLQTPPGKDSIVITGSHYFGLGMRFLVSMDRGGHFFNADDKAGVNRAWRRAADAHKVVRLHGQGRRQAGHGGPVRSSEQSAASGHHVYHEHALCLPFGHDERVERADHGEGRLPLKPLLWRGPVGRRGRQGNR